MHKLTMFLLYLQLAQFFYSVSGSETDEEPTYSNVLSPTLRRMMLLPSKQHSHYIHIYKCDNNLLLQHTQIETWKLA